MSPRTRGILAVLLLVCATLIAYYPAIRYGGYVWDDDVHLTNNPTLTSDTGLYEILFKTTWRVQYYPLTFISFWLQYRLFGLEPWSYHLVNVLFHIANALLLWGLLKRLRFRAAFWIALIFAFHPLNTESVAWVTERKNVLMACFYLSAAWAYLRFEGTLEPPPAGKSKRDWPLFALALVLFVCAVLSKTVACTFPAAMLVVLWWKGRLSTRSFLPLLPFFAVGLGLGAVTSYMEVHVVGSQGGAWAYSLPDRAIIAGRAAWFYVGKLLWPTDLSFSYTLWTINAADWTQWVMPASVLVMLAVLWLYQFKIGRGPLAAALFFLVTISPALGFFRYYTMIYSLVADHYVYIAMIGLAALAAESIARAVARAPASKNVALAAGTLVLAALALLTFQRCWVYQNPETLWRDTLQKNPRSWLARTSLGVELRRQGKVTQALQQFQTTLAIDPHCFQALNDIGTTLVDLGRPQDAEQYFKRVIQEQPRASVGYTNLASLRVRQGRPQEAEPLYRQAIELNTYDHDAHYNYGTLLAGRGRFDEAIVQFRSAVELDPRDAASHLYLARCLAQTGKLQQALPHFEEAARLKPDWTDAQQDLARIRSFLAQAR
jgi:tetratricopeptide (TPR) repeat protein